MQCLNTCSTLFVVPGLLWYNQEINEIIQVVNIDRFSKIPLKFKSSTLLLERWFFCESWVAGFLWDRLFSRLLLLNWIMVFSKRNKQCRYLAYYRENVTAYIRSLEVSAPPWVSQTSGSKFWATASPRSLSTLVALFCYFCSMATINTLSTK